MPDVPSTRSLPDPQPNSPATVTRFGSNEHSTRVFTGIVGVEPREVPSIPGYAVEGRLGVGGMGVVYKAVQQPLNRPVALKMIRGTVAPGSRSLVRFLAEAEAAAAISHENVVRVFEYGEVGGEPFLVLEFLPGGTLAERLQRMGAVDVATALNWLTAVSRGVAAAHRLGIVHRDLKPANILFDDRDVPKVSDFGLAKLRAGVDVTATQEMMGTPAYMSPEQARGESKFAGPGSDVWALGVMLYELLAGRRPFESDSSWGVIQEILTKDPPTLRGHSVPRDLAVVCLKCLAKEPHRRYASAEELADDLDRVRLGVPVSARPVSTLRRVRSWLARRPATTAALVAAAVIVVSVAVLVGKSQRDVREVRRAALVEKMRTVSPDEVPLVAAEMEPFAEDIRPRIAAVLNDPAESPAVRLNAAILLAKHDPAAIEYLWGRLPAAAVRDLPHYVAALSGSAERHPDRYWERVLEAREAAPSKVRYAAVLAAADPARASWTGVAAELSGALVDHLGGEPGEWVRLFKPVRAALHDSLMARMTLDPEGDTGFVAASFLAALYDDQPTTLVADVDRASLSQSSRFYRSLSALDDSLFPESALAVSARRKLEWTPAILPTYARVEDEVDSQLAVDADARARVRPALALLAKGRGDAVWPLFEPSSNPRIRSYLIEHAAASGIDPRILVQGLDAVRTPGMRQGLILALGNYAAFRFSPTQFDSVCARLLGLYETDPHAGVHSACRWTLEQFRMADRVRAVDRRVSTAGPVADRDWWTAPEGLSFARLPAGEGVIGSPPTEWNRDLTPAKSEDATRVFLPRATALGATEVTFEQYQRFLKTLAGPEPEKFLQPSFPAVAGGVAANDWSTYTSRLVFPHTTQLTRYFKSPDCPMGLIPWWLAMAYCRWLGESEGVPDEEQPYAPVGTILILGGTGSSLRADYLNRTGYRLPTEAEWELGARAGARTRYPFGSDERMVPKYAACQDNADDHSLPVARGKPNALGLFDVIGNAREWCHGEYVDRLPLDPSLARLDDGIHPNGTAFAPLMPRSSSFSDPRSNLRTSQRGIRFDRIEAAYGDTGLRIARTIRAAGATAVSPAALTEVVRLRLNGTGTFHVAESSGVEAFSAREGKLPFELSLRVPMAGQWVLPAFSATIENPETGEQVFATRERGEAVRLLVRRRNEQGQVFALIPPGTATLGRRTGLSDEVLGPPLPRPIAWTESARETLLIEKPFGLGIHEVTFLQFEKYTAETGYRSIEEAAPPAKRAAYLGTEGAWKEEPGTQNWITYGSKIPPNSPATYIAPADAKAYCDWLDKKQSRKYRLPTEVEWEYACRGGTATIWPFGDGVGRLTDYAWHRGNGIFVQEVGRKRPNRFGLYDMLGNVGEWSTGAKGAVLRGLDVGSLHFEVRPEMRLPSTDGRATNLTGFRIACEAWTPTFVAESLPHDLEFSPAPNVPARPLSIRDKDRHPPGVLIPTDSFTGGRGWWYAPNAAGAFGWNTANAWTVKYLDWKPQDDKALIPAESEWEQAKTRILREEMRPEVHYQWSDDGPMTLHGRPLGLSFEAEFELPAGVYELAIASGSGHRVFVDDRIELDVFTLTRYIANRTEVAMGAGRHRIRIETHKREQSPDVRFGLRVLRFDPK